MSRTRTGKEVTTSAFDASRAELDLRPGDLTQVVQAPVSRPSWTLSNVAQSGASTAVRKHLEAGHLAVK